MQWLKNRFRQLRAAEWVLFVVGGLLFLWCTPVASLVCNAGTVLGMGLGLFLMLFALFFRPLWRRTASKRALRAALIVFCAVCLLFTSVAAAKKLIRSFKPDIVIGTGGYVSWPVLKAASSMRIPTCIHEQNAVPGVTTKALSKTVNKVMISFEESREAFDCPEKLVFVGNPVSGKMLEASKDNSRKILGIDKDEKVLLSCGGSLGARPLNEKVYELIRDYSLKTDITHFHATGKAGWEVQSALYKELGFKENGEDELKLGKVTVRKYIYNMPQLLSASDAVICRAGAMTLSELAVMGKASVIIPSPYVTNNHQYKNAKVLCDKGAAVMIEEKDLTSDALIKAVSHELDDKEYRTGMENTVREFAVTDTLDRIYSIVKELVKK